MLEKEEEGGRPELQYLSLTLLASSGRPEEASAENSCSQLWGEERRERKQWEGKEGERREGKGSDRGEGIREQRGEEGRGGKGREREGGEGR